MSTSTATTLVSSTKKPPPESSKKNRKKKRGQTGKAVAIGRKVQAFLHERRLAGIALHLIKRDIPYLLPSFDKGTQYAQVRLHLTPVPLNLTSGNAYTSVLPINMSVFSNFGDICAVFSEYRFLEGEVQHFPDELSSVNAQFAGIAGIDYSSGTALTSYESAAQYDTRKFFYFAVQASQSLHPTKGATAWPVKIEKLPDMDWISTSTTNTNVAWWKPYIPAAKVAANLSGGSLYGWFDFQFRGLSPL